MKTSYNIFILVLFAIIDISRCELKKVPIKSHKVITKDFTQNEVNSMYDNDMGTTGSFYHSTTKYVQVDLDLGGNYIVEKIVVRIKKEEKKSDINFLVGNLLKGEGGLLYNCSSKIDTLNIYECIPKCRSEDPSRNGIVARKLLMSLLVRGSWASIYEIEVFAPMSNNSADFISAYRLVQPDECEAKSWLLTKPMMAADTVLKGHNIGSKIYFEKSYIVNEIHVQFMGPAPATLKLQLSNEKQKQKDVVIDIAKCNSLKSTFICQLNEITFTTRVLTIGSDGVSHLAVRGKTVFYPTLKVKTSANLKDSLKLTCTVDQCDRSVHSDCSEKKFMSGVQIGCNNKRLIRIATDINTDSYVIVNQGQVEKAWANTKFKVESNELSELVVSMPRTYQYFGQYLCNCIATDESATDINSKISTLKESDFIENLVFKTTVQYKLEESETIPYKDSTDNLIIIRDVALKNSFIVVKISAFSLVNGIVVNVNHPVSAQDTENVTVDSSTPEYIKAFNDNPQSWSVKIYKYAIDEIFSEFLHNQAILINYMSKKYNVTQDSVTRFIKVYPQTSEKPEMLKIETDKLISLKTVYTGKNEIKLISNEQTCLNTSNTTVAVLQDNSCKVLDSQAVCLYPDDVILLSVNKERNIATTYKYSLVETASNKVLNQVNVSNKLMLNQKDVNVKMRYVDINSDAATPQITNVAVEIEFISKIVTDFIPCGKVLLKLAEPEKNPKQMILQTTKHRFSVDLANGGVNVTINLEIEGLKGSFETILNIVNPTSFSISDLKIQGDSKKTLMWKGINMVADDLLVGYEVKTAVTVIACDSTEENKEIIKKLESISGKNKYRFKFGPLNKNHSLKLVVQVQPVFKNNKRGQISQLVEEMLYIKRTKVNFDNNVLPKQKSITIVPSQSEFQCPIKSVEFQLESENVEQVMKQISEINKLQYTLNDLVPGRKYRLSAIVHYQHGSADNKSETYNFETADEISILQTRHIANVNDNVNITCNADVGPMDKFRKVIEWRRADSSPLPEGVSSSTFAEVPNSAFLIMTKALADFSGDYACFVKPAAGVGGAKITVIINDLDVTPKSKKIDFSKPLEPISVKCSSSSIGDGKLVWTDSDKAEIKENENENYQITTTITKENTIESTLLIKRPMLNTSGVYECLKSIGQFKASQTFNLYGEEKLSITPLTDKVAGLVGEITRLRCVGDRATKNQKVSWEAKNIIDNDKVLLKTIYPNPSDLSVQDIEIINNMALHQVSCKLLPAVNEMNSPLKKTFQLKLATKIDVAGQKNVVAGESVNFTCIGHHDKSSAVLQWIFYQQISVNTTTTHGKIVLTSDTQPSPKSYEPMKLVLFIQQVNDSEAGRYECRFKTEVKTEMPMRKSLVLSVETNNKPIIMSNTKCDGCPTKSADTMFFTGNLSKSIYFLFIVFSLFFRF